jgi:hypothetical protein
MLTTAERNAFILLAIVAVAVIAGSVIIEAFGRSSLSEQFTNTSADGSLVSYMGKIDRLIITKNGADLILDINGTSVFIPATSATGLSIKKGDVVALYGVVQTYHGQKEIVVQRSGDVRQV